MYYGVDTRIFSVLMGGWLACVWPLGEMPALFGDRLLRDDYTSETGVRATTLAEGCGFGALVFNQLPLKEVWKQNMIKVCTPVMCCVIAYFSVLMLASNTYNPFIYFRF